MTVRECISRFGYLKPHAFDDGTVEGWLNILDGRIRAQMDKTYGTSAQNDGLALPDEYADVYIYYLQAQADYFNGETARYNNSMNMYNSALNAFWDSYNRAHMPRQREVKL